ncbi:asparagine synthase (glutamine-hydrolyzing) [Rhodoblastus sphagnicola]|nr:asparagine synthase (glutamine-hydrolyzing) [Rhodoblastus sphagnicola]
MSSAAEAAPTFGEMRRMVAMLSHRGPDGYGLYRDDQVGLVHSRLSIIDLAGGAQPLSNEDGSVWLTFNGEIFNYIELRQNLAELGHRFSTSGDSEVIVHCYERYGSRAWEMLNGQFAFALWDSRRRLLWLVRDRLGILPLHYARARGHVVFASEAKAIFAGGRIAPRVDPEGLCQAFTTWSAMAPRSAFQDIRQVPPATALCFDSALCAREQTYWRVHPARPSFAKGSADDALEAQLKRSVALRLRADVPVGAYVSGGLDSSVITSLAAEARGHVETFGIRFADPRFDETREQRLVAKHLGVHHHELLCSASDIRDALPETVWHCETPLLRTSPVPLFLLSQAVKAAGVKTVLTGEGADELLCGYTIFKEDQIRRFWARSPQSTMRPALLQRIHHYVGAEGARQNAVWQSFFSHKLLETAHPFYSHLIRWRNTAWTLRLLAPEIRNSLPLESMFADMAAELPPDWSAWDPVTRAQYIEIQGFMSSYLLSCQGDRVAMAHGVEARYPFLDPDFVDFCFTLETTDKMIGTRDKIALRRVARRRLPPEISGRRKQPFRAPIAAALFDRDEATFEDALSPSNLAASGYFDTTAVTQLLARARARGRSLGEREEMGLIGVLTLQLLNDAFGPQFRQRALEAEALLAGMRCDVWVDRAIDKPSIPPPHSVLSAFEVRH